MSVSMQERRKHNRRHSTISLVSVSHGWVSICSMMMKHDHAEGILQPCFPRPHFGLPIVGGGGVGVGVGVVGIVVVAVVAVVAVVVGSR